MHGRSCRFRLNLFFFPNSLLTTFTSFLNLRVAAVTPEHVIYTSKNEDGKMEQHTIPTNFTLWSTGIAMNPFAKRVTQLLPNQVMIAVSQ